MEKLKFKLGVSSDLRNEVLLMQESQLRFIIRLCDPLHEKKGSAIHEIRRSFKKCRSLLRLIRDSMGYAMYYRENTQMRDMHRLLSHARDADVFYSMWKALPATFNGLEAQSWYRTTLDAASAQRQAERDQLISAEVPERIRRGTRQCIDDLRHYQLCQQGFNLVEGGLSRIYRQGRSMRKDVFGSEADPALVHRYRKRAKYLQYHLTYLQTLFPPLLKATSKTLQEVTDTLGVYNDYHKAMDYISDLAPRDPKSKRQARDLLDQMESGMDALKFKSARLSKKLYAEKPRQFLSRMHSYWDSFAADMSISDQRSS